MNVGGGGRGFDTGSQREPSGRLAGTGNQRSGERPQPPLHSAQGPDGGVQTTVGFLIEFGNAQSLSDADLMRHPAPQPPWAPHCPTVLPCPTPTPQ